ncbi:MAG TPA: OmpA family protein [Hyphomicrobiaceae bacterium]|nr:OmpA family protein [Hyphomicrobiaceae bacterium]
MLKLGPVLASIALAVSAGAVAVPFVWDFDVPGFSRADIGAIRTETGSPPAATPAPIPVPQIASPRPLPPQASTPLSFDVVRMDPDRVSVLAGKAPANAEVRILLDGDVIATTKADGSGNWVVTTSRRFAAGSHRLSIAAEVDGRLVQGPSVIVKLETATGLVAMAEQPKPVRRTTPATSQPPPVTFVFREATVTSEGQAALQILQNFIRANGVQKLVLTGHADERGEAGFNLELSRERLESVARYLRSNGFGGELVLEPKGASEPYAGVDRQHTPREQLYQLDRRVEVKLHPAGDAAGQSGGGGVAAHHARPQP